MRAKTEVYATESEYERICFLTYEANPQPCDAPAQDFGASHMTKSPSWSDKVVTFSPRTLFSTS